LRLLTVVIIGLLLCSFACITKPNEPEDWAGPRELKPYNPVKAGATIVESFDLTDNSFVYKSSNSSPEIPANYDIAECNDTIYIRLRTKMFIFDKETFQKKSELNLNFQNYSLFDRNYIGKFAVINENIIGFDWGHTYKYSAFIGYDKANTSIWMLINNEEGSRNDYFHYFQYDNLTQTLSLSGKKEGFILAPSPRSYFEPNSYEAQSWAFAGGLSICGDESWNIIYFKHTMTGAIVAVRLEKRNFDNPTEVVQFIDVEYLGTLSIPNSIIYDPPYIWMLAEKNNKVLMLKLLPNDKN